jgi:hypothetical protein
MSISDAKRFHEEQIDYLVAGKTDEQIDAHYQADALLSVAARDSSHRRPQETLSRIR